ncbi:transcriptional regulator [Lewinellaceae bacterium SD302]|nr:transcriptional regulator [Lewinellaceae bacterium SD302]
MKQLIIFGSCLLLVILTGCSGPKAIFESPTRVQAFEYVDFTNASQNAVAYEWNFGDGSSSTEANPKHRFYQSGTYSVSLIATDAKGKSKTTSSIVEVTSPKRCLVRIETPEGEMIAQLSDATPQHQDNFVKLVEQNYYDGLLFHRVINNFMIQGGDPKSKEAPKGQALGSGGPGYTIPAEFVDSLAHVKGALAAARTNNPQKASSGSQFYIVDGRPVSEAELNQQEAKSNFRYPSAVREQYLEMGGTPFLDQGYTVFGRIIEGLDVIDKISKTATGPGDRPEDDVWMKISLIR